MIPSDEKGTRTFGMARTTGETDITIRIDLDGSGKSDIQIEKDEEVNGVAFLTHMLHSLARFGDFDLQIHANGDFTHHIWEDVGITLGETFRHAIQDRKLARIGHSILPMDDALVLVAVDLIDRPYVEIDLPDEMELLEHVLRSFALESRITLHTQVLRGKNPHHIVEATYKGLGMALHNATRPTREFKSTKDTVVWKKLK